MTDKRGPREQVKRVRRLAKRTVRRAIVLHKKEDKTRAYLLTDASRDDEKCNKERAEDDVNHNVANVLDSRCSVHRGVQYWPVIVAKSIKPARTNVDDV